MNSWHTTIMGVASILAAVVVAVFLLVDGDPNTTINGTTGTLLLAIIGNGVGNVMARDNHRRSEWVNARGPEPPE